MARKKYGKSKRWEGSKDFKDLSLLDQYKRLSQRADKRLQRLEKRFNQPGYEGLEKWAYARAMRDIKAWSGKKGTRFGTKIPEFDDMAAQERYLRAKINDINTFLRSSTSTISGGMESEGILPLENGAKTFSKKYGAKFTWQQLGSFYESQLSKKLSEQFGSNTIAKAIGRFKRLSDKGINPREAMENDPHFKLSSTKLTKAAMEKMLDEGFQPSDFFKNSFKKRKK